MIDIQSQIPLAPYTTFKIGGLARYWVDVHTEAELLEALDWARDHGEAYVVIAGGSNVLISDEGFSGLVIHMCASEIKYGDTFIETGAGTSLLAIIQESANHGLGGWEKMAGIPGTIGGAVRGNAGAFGSEMKDVLVWARAVHAETREVRIFENDACAFAYRTSFFKQNSGWIITAVRVRLSNVSPAKSLSIIEDTLTQREKRHLQNVRAAGSYFTNPVAPIDIQERFELEKGQKSREGRVPAGWLIDIAGLKGRMVGGAQISAQHGDYIINASGSASAADVHALAEEAKRVVREQFGIELHEEAVRI